MTKKTPQFRIVPQEFREVPIDSIQPHPQNVNEGDVGAIYTSMEYNGWFGAVLVQKSSNNIIAGKHRWIAANQAGAITIPAIVVDVDDEAVLRLMLADNRTAQLGHNNEPALADLLSAMLNDTGTLLGTGFNKDFLDDLIKDISAPDSFPVQDENIATEHECPKCGYKWSGGKSET